MFLVQIGLAQALRWLNRLPLQSGLPKGSTCSDPPSQQTKLSSGIVGKIKISFCLLYLCASQDKHGMTKRQPSLLDKAKKTRTSSTAGPSPASSVTRCTTPEETLTFTTCIVVVAFDLSVRSDWLRASASSKRVCVLFSCASQHASFLSWNCFSLKYPSAYFGKLENRSHCVCVCIRVSLIRFIQISSLWEKVISQVIPKLPHVVCGFHLWDFYACERVNDPGPNR